MVLHSRSIHRSAANRSAYLLLACLAGVSLAQTPGSAAPAPPLLSQAPQFPTVTQPGATQSGNQIVLNGRSLPIAWRQWRVGNTIRTGVSDVGLVQAAGVELLSTSDRTQQPIQWFSQPATTASILATRVSNGFRYLDVTDFARQQGWQVQPNGLALQVTSPAASVLAIRQGKQPWGDRLVIELDRAAPWQVDQQNQELVLTVDAQTAATVVQAFKPNLSAPVQSAKVETTSGKTFLRLGIPLTLRPRVWSLPNPNRLIVDIRSDSQVDQDIAWAAGVRLRRQTLTLGSDRFPVTYLEVNPRQPGVRIQPLLPNSTSVIGTAPVAQTARQAQASAAINGGFFNRNNQLPLGAIRREGRWISGPILNRGAIGWNAAGDLFFGRLTLQETLTTLPVNGQNGQSFSLAYLNSAYPQIGIARYTPDWGATYQPLTDNETVVTVENNRVVSQQPIAKAGSSGVPIPPNGYLLALRALPTAAQALAIGTSVTVTSTTNLPEFNRFPNIVAAGPLLIQNRQIVLSPEIEKFSPAFVAEKASRSAIGQTAAGSVLIVTVHNRINGLGPSLSEIAQLMQQLGAINALNLDGGSSTTLYLGGQIIDRLPRTAARVHDVIGVFVPSDP